MDKKKIIGIAIAILVAAGAIPNIDLNELGLGNSIYSDENYGETLTIEIPEYEGLPYTYINGNIPFFTEEELADDQVFERFSKLDVLGRAGRAYANLSPDLMPTEERESISEVKPTGWQTAYYDFVDGGYLYNRCHLIAFQLSGENANELNLITGTRTMNVLGMLPFENMVAEYIKDTGSTVLYRVTPIYEGDNLVATGVLMEGYSQADKGFGVCFNVFCFNMEPGVAIDYATGYSCESSDNIITEDEASYVLNAKTGKFHLTDCDNVDSMSDKNKIYITAGREEMVDIGYSPSGCCNP